MKRWRTLLSHAVAVAVALFSAGCAPIGTFQSATTVKPGYWRAQLRPEVMNPLPGDENPVAFGTDVEIRYGVHQEADMGVRFGSSGLVVDGKKRVSSSQNFNVAVNPSFGVLFYRLYETTTVEETDAGGETVTETVKTPNGSITSLEFGLPLIFGYQFFPGGPEIVLAPKVLGRHSKYRVYSYATLTTLDRTWELIGAVSLGFRLPIPGGFELFPEASVGYPMATASSTQGNTPELLFTGGIGIGFGPDTSRYYNRGDSMPF